MPGILDPEDRGLLGGAPLSVGQVQYGQRPMWGAAGAFGPRDLFNAGGMAVGGLAGLMGSGGRGLAQYMAGQGAQQAGRAALQDPAERLFAQGLPMALGIGAVPATASAKGKPTRADVMADAVSMTPQQFIQKYGKLPEAVLSDMEKK